MATRAIYGEDLLAAAGIDWKPYSKLVNERASAQQVVADRKADGPRTESTKTVGTKTVGTKS